MLDLSSVLKGKFEKNYPLQKLTWFQVGGPCSYFFKPHDVDDLSVFMKKKPKDYPVLFLGAGSNILIRDGGFNGCVIKLAGYFNKIEVEGDVVVAGAGVLDRTFALTLADEGLSNLEFMVSIPGTIGGALAMNAGAYGHEIKDHLLWIDLMSPDGQVIRLLKNEINMTYRNGNLPKNYVILKAAFQIQKKSSDIVKKSISEILEQRALTQPTKGRTGGSTFKNPKNLSAWKLIDDAGCRGMSIGQAQVSEKHCNFLLNLGGACAKDIETLGNTVQEKVLKRANIKLEWEIIRIGESK